MFKNKMNAYGFMILVGIWALTLLLGIFQVPMMTQASAYVGIIMVFFFYLISKEGNNGFAIVGFIIGVLGSFQALGSGLIPGLGMMAGMGGGYGGMVALSANALLHIAFLFFAFGFINNKSKTINWMGWILMLVFIITPIYLVPYAGEIIVNLIKIGLAGLFVYYLATEAGINLPGNIDEQVKEKLG